MVQIKALNPVALRMVKTPLGFSCSVCNIINLSPENSDIKYEAHGEGGGDSDVETAARLTTIVLSACNIGGGTGNSFHVSAGVSAFAIQHCLKNAYKVFWVLIEITKLDFFFFCKFNNTLALVLPTGQKSMKACQHVSMSAFHLVLLKINP